MKKDLDLGSGINNAMQHLLGRIRTASFTCGEFLLTEAQVAHTFLNIAERCRNRAAVERNVQHARNALTIIDQYAEQVMLENDQLEKLKAARDELHARLTRLDTASIRTRTPRALRRSH